MARRALPLFGLPILFVVVTLSTYRSAADGAFDAFARSVVLVAGASMVVFGVLRLCSTPAATGRMNDHVGPPAPRGRRRAIIAGAPWLALVLLLASCALGHTARVLHPARRGASFVSIEERFAGARLDPARWEVSADPVGAYVSVRPGQVRLAVQPGARASLELKPPPAKWWTRSPAAWLLPLRFDARQFGEQIEWHARVVRERTFFVMTETPGLLLQLAPYGVHLTVRAPGATSAAELNVPALNAAADHTWRVGWADGVTTLDLDGNRLWARSGTPPLGPIRFGETRSDDLHGGELRISWVVYRRWWQPPTSGV